MSCQVSRVKSQTRRNAVHPCLGRPVAKHHVHPDGNKGEKVDVRMKELHGGAENHTEDKTNETLAKNVTAAPPADGDGKVKTLPSFVEVSAQRLSARELSSADIVIKRTTEPPLDKDVQGPLRRTKELLVSAQRLALSDDSRQRKNLTKNVALSDDSRQRKNLTKNVTGMKLKGGAFRPPTSAPTQVGAAAVGGNVFRRLNISPFRRPVEMEKCP